MGNKKWMSKGSSRKGVNLRAPATTKTQKGQNARVVFWTPVFARGQVRIYMCPARDDPDSQNHPAKLNDSVGAATFVRDILPGILEEMQDEYGWSTLPREIVHEYN